MRFTPTDRPKKPLVEDTAKKIHVKFDNDDDSVVPQVENKKRSSSDPATIDHQHKKQKTKVNQNDKSGRKAVQITVPGASSPKSDNKKRSAGKGITGEDDPMTEQRCLWYSSFIRNTTKEEDHVLGRCTCHS